MKNIPLGLCLLGLLLAASNGCKSLLTGMQSAVDREKAAIAAAKTSALTNAVPSIPSTPSIPQTTPAANSAQIKAAMFLDATGSPFSETINRGVTSPQGWALCHGKSWENDFRRDILQRLKAAGSDTLVYLVDSTYRNAPVLAMCLADMTHPDDGHHMVADEGWYDDCLAAGVVRHIAILRDSPDSSVAVARQSVVDLVQAYDGARWKEVIYLTGLESKRNTTVEQTVQLVKWFRIECKNRVVVGDQSPDYLLAVAAQCDAELWLEQPTHPTQQPLTLATADAYLASLARLAAKVGAGKVWAGEWWAASLADRRTITAQILAAGYNCGCGAFQ